MNKYFKYVNFSLILVVLMSCSKRTDFTSTDNTISSIEISENSTLVSSTDSLISSVESTKKDAIYKEVEPNYTGDYYTSISELITGRDLVLALDSLLDKTAKNTFTYKNMFSIFAFTDVDSSGSLVSFYSGNLSTAGKMNREHVWPNSRGGNYIENDPHAIRPTITSENSARGNDFFNENGKWDPASFNNPKYRGIAARIIFYCAVKQQEKLSLVDQFAETNWNTNKTMGKLSTLLKWNFEYDIDETEILRNNTLAEKYLHCRNPFIDNRNYACKIWGEVSDETRKVCRN